MDIFYVNDRFVDESQASISVNDLAILRGYGVFDFLRTYNNKPFHLSAHLDRLEKSARLVGLQLPQTKESITELVDKGLAQSDHDEKNIRIVLTGGVSGDGITPPDTSGLLILITQAKSVPESWLHKGAKIITSHTERFMPGAKSINYIPAILSQNEARAQGAIEAIFVDRDGYLLEGTTSNLFVVKDNTLITPPCDRILPGITRQVVLQLARKEKDLCKVTERRIHKDEIALLDEAFITSSIREVVPVIAIDSLTIGNGQVGTLTQKSVEDFRKYANSYGQ